MQHNIMINGRKLMYELHQCMAWPAVIVY